MIDTGHRILLYKGKGFVSWMIKKQTRRIYSHLAVLLPDLTVIESTCRNLILSPFSPGVIHRHFLEREKKICDRFIVDGHTPDMWQISEDFLWMHVENKTKYDPRGILRFVTKVPHNKNDKMYCSELGFDALEVSGTKILSRVCGSEVSPGMASLSPKLIYDPWD